MPKTIDSDSLTAGSLIIDSLKLVHERQRFRGLLPVARLLRLAETLQNSSGNIEYAVAGDVDAMARPLLRLKVSGAVQLQCQRCLDGFEHGVDIDTALRLVAPEVLETEGNEDPDEPDCVATSAALDLAALIEDEVLLALPPYPMHESASCRAYIGNAQVASQSIEAFSVLKALKTK